jgi:hypothetical protein
MWQQAGAQVGAALRQQKVAQMVKDQQLETIGELKRRMNEQQKRRVPENEWETATGGGIVFPCGPRMLVWDLLVAVVTLYATLVDPFRVAFDVPSEGGWLVFELCISLLFLADLCVSFTEAYLDGEGYWVIHRASIARRYFRGWFWVDMPTALPVELIPLLTDRQGGEHLHIIRLLRLVRIARIFRLGKLSDQLQDIGEIVRLNQRILELLRLVTILLYTTHYMACAWRLVAGNEWAKGRASFLSNSYLLEGYLDAERLSALDEAQLVKHVCVPHAMPQAAHLSLTHGPLTRSLGLALAGRQVKDLPVTEIYVECMLYALCMLLVMGYQDMTPVSCEERIFTIFSLVLGVLAFGCAPAAAPEELRRARPPNALR